MIYLDFEERISSKMSLVCENYQDPSHDFSHIKRVVNLSKILGDKEKANLDVIVPAAYMHDIVSFEKNDPRRSKASKFSADAALLFLESLNYPEIHFKNIAHSIKCHSFSANITPTTLEAKVVQDADRLDALGAIGIARMFCISGRLGSSFYDLKDPLAMYRELDDKKNTFDHFFTKILKLQDGLNTDAAKVIGKQRTDYIRSFIEQLKTEILP